MDAADAEAVILPASAVPDEERPLLPPLLTSAHNSISPLCFLGGQHSFCFTPFAALSLSMIEDFSRVSGALASRVLSSFGPLLMIPLSRIWDNGVNPEESVIPKKSVKRIRRDRFCL